MSTMLRNHLGRCWSQDVNETDQYLAARPDPLMSNIVCVVCPRGVFFLGVLGLLGPILFLIYMDDIQHCTIVTVDFTYLLMTLM